MHETTKCHFLADHVLLVGINSSEESVFNCMVCISYLDMLYHYEPNQKLVLQPLCGLCASLRHAFTDQITCARAQSKQASSFWDVS